MTNEEAKQRLQSIYMELSEENKQAIDKAIEALNDNCFIPEEKIRSLCGVDFEEAERVLILYRNRVLVHDKTELEWYLAGYRKALDDTNSSLKKAIEHAFGSKEKGDS